VIGLCGANHYTAKAFLLLLVFYLRIQEVPKSSDRGYSLPKAIKIALILQTAGNCRMKIDL